MKTRWRIFVWMLQTRVHFPIARPFQRMLLCRSIANWMIRDVMLHSADALVMEIMTITSIRSRWHVIIRFLQTRTLRWSVTSISLRRRIIIVIVHRLRIVNRLHGLLSCSSVISSSISTVRVTRRLSTYTRSIQSGELATRCQWAIRIMR